MSCTAVGIDCPLFGFFTPECLERAQEEGFSAPLELEVFKDNATLLSRVIYSGDKELTVAGRRFSEIFPSSRLNTKFPEALSRLLAYAVCAEEARPTAEGPLLELIVKILECTKRLSLCFQGERRCKIDDLSKVTMQFDTWRGSYNSLPLGTGPDEPPFPPIKVECSLVFPDSRKNLCVEIPADVASSLSDQSKYALKIDLTPRGVLHLQTATRARRIVVVDSSELKKLGKRADSLFVTGKKISLFFQAPHIIPTREDPRRIACLYCPTTSPDLVAMRTAVGLPDYYDDESLLYVFAIVKTPPPEETDVLERMRRCPSLAGWVASMEEKPNPKEEGS